MSTYHDQVKAIWAAAHAEIAEIKARAEAEVRAIPKGTSASGGRARPTGRQGIMWGPGNNLFFLVGDILPTGKVATLEDDGEGRDWDGVPVPGWPPSSEN